MIVLLFLTFAKIEAGREREVYLVVAKGKIIKISNVKDIYLTFGEQDLVLIHEASNLSEAIQTTVKLRNIPGITDTHTIVCMDIEEAFR